MSANPSSVKACWAGRGRGWSEALCFDGCVCQRPHYVVLCHYCGFYCRGRLRIHCKLHPCVQFLLDIDRCPKCKSYQYMMSECRVDDLPREPGTYPPVLPAKAQQMQAAFELNVDSCCNQGRTETRKKIRVKKGSSRKREQKRKLI